ncbi:MAG: HAMP domain-containing histidine kinase [bacterium]|nr:HAMP domain-containing histidine kinase [bacterium]
MTRWAPSSKSDNGIHVSRQVLGAIVGALVALIVAALLHVNAYAVTRFMDDSTLYADGEAALVSTQLSLRTLSQAVLLAEDVVLGVADTSTADDALGEADRVLDSLRNRVANLDLDADSYEPAFTQADSVIAALERGDVTGAGSLLATETLDAYESLRDSIASSRDTSLGHLSNAEGLARRLGTIAGFLVALLAPAVAILVYWRIARRQLSNAHVQIDARLHAEKRVVQAKDEFIANISHELRTPLTSIYGFSEILVDQGLIDPDEAHTLISVINGESAELNRMVEDLLTSARAEAGTIAYNYTETDLAKETATVVKPLERLGVAINVDLPPLHLWSDQLRTRQVLRNLLSNAQKWGGHDIRVSGDKVGDLAAIVVADNGPGVPEDVVSRLFTRFIHEGDSPLTAGSIGLGLAVVKILVTDMGGTITYNRSDGWSRFMFTLPLASAGMESSRIAPPGDGAEAPVAVPADTGPA